ncbi:hypothetical protein [Aquisphaera insulae]|uniref:hypothetical protein n=1 Tax=Aquisphaera insulae TaxID=2712864 RepID=UPI0013EAAF40|nr:hypothetical protein [Aquisphaera insulae]
MTPSLERLAELVRQAEAKTRARKIEGEIQQAADQFRATELRARHAVERLRTARPASLKALEQADADEQLLKDLVRKLAQFKSSLESQGDAEQLISTSQAEIERIRKQSRADLEEIAREVDEARRELRTALDQYRQLRKELDRLLPELAERFAAEDRLLWDAESHFPGGQLQLLAHEVDAGLNAYANLGKLEQYARLKVWIGRFRCYQAAHERDNDTTEELQTLGHRVFHQLKWMSRQYEPGYIEAFRQDFSTDWNAYVAEAQDQLVQAIEAGRRNRDAAATSGPSAGGTAATPSTTAAAAASASASAPTPAPAEAPASRAAAPAASASSSSSSATAVATTSRGLTDLKQFMTRAHLPEEGLDRFLDLLDRAAAETGSNDVDLLRLAYPYRRYIAGAPRLDAIRRNLDRAHAGNGASSGSRHASPN